MIFDFVHVLQGDCTLKQALIKDKRNPNLYLLAASQTKDKTALTVDGVGKMLQEMRREFDFILCDSPAGIESGAKHAMYFADDAIIVTNPELSSCRDSDKMIGFISSRSKRAELGQEAVRQSLLVTRYDPGRAEKEECLRLDDIKELLGLELLGVIPESKCILTATNIGQPVICMQDEEAGQGASASNYLLGKKHGHLSPSTNPPHVMTILPPSPPPPPPQRTWTAWSASWARRRSCGSSAPSPRASSRCSSPAPPPEPQHNALTREGGSCGGVACIF